MKESRTELKEVSLKIIKEYMNPLTRKDRKDIFYSLNNSHKELKDSFEDKVAKPNKKVSFVVNFCRNNLGEEFNLERSLY